MKEDDEKETVEYPDRVGLGDKQGTQIGETDAGNEAARGIHGANRGGDPQAPGSEPLEHRDEEHQSNYGGGGRTR